MIKIAQLSCGTEYSSVQYEIEKAARSVGANIVHPDVSAGDIDKAVKRFGFNPRSPQLKLMIARAVQLADRKYDADAEKRVLREEAKQEGKQEGAEMLAKLISEGMSVEDALEKVNSLLSTQ